MLVQALIIEGLRNIRKGSMDLGGQSAMVVGANGAGKTTVLEALYLLARGRTFRGRRAGDLTTFGLQETRIAARVEEGGLSVDWAFVRGGRNHGRWVDGVLAGGEAQCKARLAVRLVGENAPQLLEGDPALRRRFLDWNLFHVEQGYGSVLARYRSVLEQRNAWLRQGGRGRAIWDDELITAGDLLDQLRRQGFATIAAAFGDLSATFESLVDVVPVYLSGTPRDRSLADALSADSGAERSAGFTRVGPHRADFTLVRAGDPIALSRGQIKLAVCLLQLACDAAELATSSVRAIWLLDDMRCDLDDQAADRLIALFVANARQCVFTAIGPEPDRLMDRLPASARLFHLLQGDIAIRI